MTALLAIAKTLKKPVSYSRLMIKETVTHSYLGILLSNRKQKSVDTHNLDGYQGHYVE